MLSGFNRGFISESAHPTVHSRFSSSSPALKIPAFRTNFTATEEYGDIVFNQFKSHSGAQGIGTKTATLALLCNVYTDYHKIREDRKTEDDLCACKVRCATCSKPLSTNRQEAKKVDGATEVKNEVKKNKMVMPAVEIPYSLKNSLLLKVVQYQIGLLHRLMDNEKHEGPASKKVKAKGGT